MFPSDLLGATADVCAPHRLPAVAAVLGAVPVPTVLLDPDGIVLCANEAWAAAVAQLDDPGRAAGVGADYFAMSADLTEVPGARAVVDRLRALARGEGTTVRHEYELRCAQGSRWYQLEATRVDARGHLVVTHSDVTGAVLARRETDWVSRHDLLTALPNRSGMHELVDAALRAPGRGPVSLLLLDVDGFTDVNDSLGHQAGDELLRQVAARLSRCGRATDRVGRLGGDEFLLLSPDCPPDGAALLADRCRSALAEPFAVAGRTVRLGASVGIATAPAGAAAAGATCLVRDADLALAAAKAGGRNSVHVFAPELRAAAQRKVALAEELRDAIDGGRLTLHYQPVVHLPSGEVSGVEALVRWHHPERGLLGPGEFLPVAEAHDLLTPLTRWVLRTVAAQGVAWAAAGVPLLVGANVSAGHCASGELVDDVQRALDETGLPPSRLVVELTETSVAADPASAAAQFAELCRRGVEVAIDDFGSGFSSLGQLVTIPAGLLKIDRSLVAFPAQRPAQSTAAIAAVVALARACGMRALAEGVETAEQLALVTELGCTFAQGFHIARPMPAAEVLPWVAARRGAAVPAGR
ncbi:MULTISPECIES: putative bifunctional diguanylate cyclase/phosphodiesterase [unclassified Blastococcus]